MRCSNPIFTTLKLSLKLRFLTRFWNPFAQEGFQRKGKIVSLKFRIYHEIFFFATFSQNLAKKAKVKGYCYEWEITYIPFSRFENLLCLDSEPPFPKCWNLSIKKILYLKLKKLSWELVLNKTINWRMLSILWQIFKYKEHAFSPILGLAFCCKGFSGAVNLAKYNPGVFSR